jgi:valyl-tRNA synthetase
MLKLTIENIAYQEEIDTFESISVDYDKDVFNANLVFYFEVSKEDKAKEQEALLKQKEVLESQIARREKLLSNPGYVNNAPKALVEEEKTKLENEKKELEIINSKLS